MSSEQIFVVSATSNPCIQAVKDLLTNSVQVTIYVRDPTKARSFFTDHSENLTIVQGDYNDLTPYYSAIRSGNYRRLLLLVSGGADNATFEHLKEKFAKAAYEAGVKQIVDISSVSAGLRWRSNFDAADHYYAEKAMLEIPNRGNLVCLRAGGFMSNVINLDIHGIRLHNKYFGAADPDENMAWISPNDIGVAAARILQEDISKHGDEVYELVGDVLTATATAAVISKIAGRDIQYEQVDPVARYTMLLEHAHLPHRIAYALLDMNESHITASRGLPVLLGRKPQTLEQYLASYKDQLQN